MRHVASIRLGSLMQHSLHSIPRHTFVLVQIRDGLSRRLMLLWNKWHAEKNKTRSVDKKSLFHIHLLQLKMQSVFMRAYIYLYIYICVCVSCFCVYVATKDYVYVWCKIYTILICCTYIQFINVEDNIFIVSGSIVVPQQYQFDLKGAVLYDQEASKSFIIYLPLYYRQNVS